MRLPVAFARRRTARGALAVEFALLAVPFILMTLAVVDYARAMFTYNELVKATREGARLLSAFYAPTSSSDPNYTMYQNAKTAAKNRTVYGTNAAGTTPIIPGLTTTMVEICDRANSAACAGQSFSNVPAVDDAGANQTGTLDLVRVQIHGYKFTSIFPLATNWIAKVSFEDVGTTMRQGP